MDEIGNMWAPKWSFIDCDNGSCGSITDILIEKPDVFVCILIEVLLKGWNLSVKLR